MKNFKIANFEFSETAIEQEIDNSIPSKYKSRIEELVNNILDPLCDAWKSKSGDSGIEITSGYRCPKLNEAVGGSSTSAHSYAYAADMVPKNCKINDFTIFAIQWIYNNNIKFDLFIDEYNKDGDHWIHIGIKNKSGEQGKQYLLYRSWASKKYTKIDPKTYYGYDKSTDTIRTSANAQSGSGSSSGSSSSNNQTTNLQSSQMAGNTGITWAGINFIVYNELGGKRTFGYTMSEQDLHGKNNKDAGGHLTYGYGLLYHPTANKKMDEVKKVYTQLELEQLFLQAVKNRVDKIKSKVKVNLTLLLLEAMTCAYYNMGKFLNSDVVSLIKKNPNDPTIKNTWAHMSDVTADENGWGGLKKRRAREAEWYFNGNNGSYSNSAPAGSSDSIWSQVTNTANNIYNSLFGDDGVRVNYNEYVTTGGNTQTGSTEGLLTGNSIYYDKQVEDITASGKTKENNSTFNDNINNAFDIEEVKKSNIYQKDENGDPILDENGTPKISDAYLFNIDEGNDMIRYEEVQQLVGSDPEISIVSINQNNTSYSSTNQNNTSTHINNPYSIPSFADIEYRNANTPESRERLEKERLKINLEKWLLRSQDLSKELAKIKLYEWLKKQNIMLLNAFYIIIIKDMIDRIKSLSEQLQNTSQFNMMNLLNSLYDIISIFEDLGVTPDAEGITIDDLKNLGMAVVGTIADTGVNIGNLVYSNAMKNINLNMITDILGNINNTINGVSNSINSNIDNISSSISNVGNNIGGSISNVGNSINNIGSNIGDSFSSNNILNAAGSNMIANMVDGGINNIINTTQNINLNSVTGAADELKNKFTNALIKKEPFTYNQMNQGKIITINIVINKDPATNIIKIKSFLNSFKDGNNENIFNAGAIKYIKDTFNNVWNTKEELEIYIDAVIDGITKHYIFNFTINNN